MASLPEALWQQLGLKDGDRVRVSQGDGFAVLPARRDATLAPGTVRVPAGHPDTASLGAMFGTLTLELPVDGWRVLTEAEVAEARERIRAAMMGAATLSVPHLDGNLGLSYAYWRVGRKLEAR